MTNKHPHQLTQASAGYDKATGYLHVSDAGYAEGKKVPVSWMKRGETVLEFGADATGVSSSSTAIQAAIDATPDGGTCFVPVGDYLIDTPLVINRSMRFCGEGRGNLNNPLEGSRLVLSGANDTILIINDGSATTGNPTGVSVADLTLDGKNLANSVCLQLGPEDGVGAGPRACVAALDRLHIKGGAKAGILCNQAQLNSWNHLFIDGCNGDGVYIANENGGNTTITAFEVRAYYCDRGVVIEQLTNGRFIGLDCEDCDREGLLIVQPNTSARIWDCAFYGLRLENNCKDLTAGLSQLRIYSSAGGGNRPRVFLDYPRATNTPATLHDYRIGGADVSIRYPRFDEGGILETSANLGMVDIDQRDDPTTTWAMDATGSGANNCYALCRRIVDANPVSVEEYRTNSQTTGWIRRLQSSTSYDVHQNTSGDTTNKNSRYFLGHYLSAEEPLTVFNAVSGSGLGYVEIGGGTGLGNAATRVSLRAASNYTTTTGTEIVRVDAGGAEVLSGNLEVPSGVVRGYITGSGAPTGVVTPTAIGQDYLDTAADAWYRSTGATSADWLLLAPELNQYQASAGDPIGQTVTPAVGRGSRYFDTSSENWWIASGATTADWRRATNQQRSWMSFIDETRAAGSPRTISNGTTATLFLGAEYGIATGRGTQSLIVNDAPDANGVFRVTDATALYQFTLNLSLIGVSTYWIPITLELEKSTSASGPWTTVDNGFNEVKVAIPPSDLTGVGTDTHFISLTSMELEYEYYRFRLTNRATSAYDVTISTPTHVIITPIEDIY